MQAKFILDLPLTSKARPRFGQGRSYLPAKYRAWKDEARTQLRRIWEVNSYPTLDNFSLNLDMYGNGRGDIDNYLGAFLDAGLPDKKTGWAGAWRDDRVTVVSRICIAWHRSKTQYWQAVLEW